MPVVSFSTDAVDRTVEVVAEFAADIERVWQVYADPRQLERIWGPPSHPATVVDHSLVPGGRVTYYMTGPDGERYHGYWDIARVEAPKLIEFIDAFADDQFHADPNLPKSRAVWRFRPIAGGTRLTATSTYASTEDLQTVVDMGIEEGTTLAFNQVDDLLADE